VPVGAALRSRLRWKKLTTTPQPQSSVPSRTWERRGHGGGGGGGSKQKRGRLEERHDGGPARAPDQPTHRAGTTEFWKQRPKPPDYDRPSNSEKGRRERNARRRGGAPTGLIKDSSAWQPPPSASSREAGIWEHSRSGECVTLESGSGVRLEPAPTVVVRTSHQWGQVNHALPASRRHVCLSWPLLFPRASSAGARVTRRAAVGGQRTRCGTHPDEAAGL